MVATLVMDVDEKGGLFEGYDLKLNSYDLGVDIELADAFERIRFEHPEVRAVLLRSGKPRVFCAGANIRMLASASHAHKVNFCKFTNETRNAIEEMSAGSGVRTICVINGTAAGGGYELALAADHIILVDDGSASVSLPEVPLLAVLPGTGGLTRVIDKRKVRRDRADVFCTTEEGVKGRRAVDWGLVDEAVPNSRLEAAVASPGTRIRRRRSAGQARTRLKGCRCRRWNAASRRIGAITNMSACGLIAPGGSRPSRCADRTGLPTRTEQWPGRARRSGRCDSPANSTTPSSTSVSTRPMSPPSCSNRKAIRARCWHTTCSSTRIARIGWRAKSASNGSACSSASTSPRARWSR